MNIEEMKFIIQRIDTAISNTNTKSTIVLGINTFIIGGMVTNYSILDNIASSNSFIRFLVYCSLFGIIISALFSVYSIYPIFKSKNSEEEIDTAMFFMTIAKKGHKSYKEYISSEKYSFENDIASQIVEVAKISTDKHNILRASIIVFVVGAVIPWILILLSTI